jgi:hypothetical protein
MLERNVNTSQISRFMGYGVKCCLSNFVSEFQEDRKEEVVMHVQFFFQNTNLVKSLTFSLGHKERTGFTLKEQMNLTKPKIPGVQSMPQCLQKRVKILSEKGCFVYIYNLLWA